jgi:DNA repair exonuclease SbcCD ATPase subunit
VQVRRCPVATPRKKVDKASPEADALRAEKAKKEALAIEAKALADAEALQWAASRGRTDRQERAGRLQRLLRSTGPAHPWLPDGCTVTDFNGCLVAADCASPEVAEVIADLPCFLDDVASFERDEKKQAEQEDDLRAVKSVEKELRDDLDNVREEMKLERQGFDERLAEMQAEVDQAKQDFDDARDEIASLEQAYADRDASLLVAKAQNRKCKQQSAQAASDLDALVRQLEALRREVENPQLRLTRGGLSASLDKLIMGAKSALQSASSGLDLP